MTNFQKYHSINNSHNLRNLNDFKSCTQTISQFYLQEKIHGTNFSFICDGNTVECGKRSGLLQQDENFYNFQLVKEKYEKCVLNLFHGFVEEDGIRSIAIYGELFGGSYNHPDVETCNVKKIQKGVSYHPNVEFMAFDMKIEFSDFQSTFVHMTFFYALCKQYGIPVVPVFFKGSLEECLNYPVENVQTKVPDQFNLPALENNFIEGYVLKPEFTRYQLHNGERAVLKIKTKKFLENVRASNPMEIPALPKHISNFVSIAMNYINEVRYDNVVSKEGLDPVCDMKCFGKVLGLFNKDVIEDFIRENPDFNKLEKSDQKLVTKEINTLSAAFLKHHIINPK